MSQKRFRAALAAAALIAALALAVGGAVPAIAEGAPPALALSVTPASIATVDLTKPHALAITVRCATTIGTLTVMMTKPDGTTLTLQPGVTVPGASMGFDVSLTPAAHGDYVIAATSSGCGTAGPVTVTATGPGIVTNLLTTPGQLSAAAFAATGVTFTGSGFHAGAALTVTPTAPGFTPTTVRTGEGGDFSFVQTGLANTPDGFYSTSFTGQQDGVSLGTYLVGVAPPTTSDPRLTLSTHRLTLSQYLATGVTATAIGYAPGDLIIVEDETPSGTRYLRGNGPPDASGGFAVTIAAAPNAAADRLGIHTVTFSSFLGPDASDSFEVVPDPIAMVEVTPDPAEQGAAIRFAATNLVPGASYLLLPDQNLASGGPVIVGAGAEHRVHRRRTGSSDCRGLGGAGQRAAGGAAHRDRSGVRAERLTTHDYDSVLGAINGLAIASSRDEFVDAVLRELPPLVRSDVTSLNAVDPEAGRVVYASTPESFVYAENSERVFVELAHEHPLIRDHAETGDGSAVRVSDLLDDDAWHRTAIYQRFYAPMGVEQQMSITVPAPAPIVVGIAVNRLERDFDDRDRAVLNLVRPHAAQSWRRAREHERLTELLTAARSTFARTGADAVVLGDPVFELTEGALDMLYRFFGRPAPKDALPSRVRRWLDSQRGGRGSGSGDLGLELSRPLRATLGDRQLILRHLPGVGGGSDAILVNERSADASTATTMGGVGLSERELGVLRLLGSGASNAEIARRLSLSVWTVKRHLSNIYATLGVSSRVLAAAVSLEIDTRHDAAGS